MFALFAGSIALAFILVAFGIQDTLFGQAMSWVCSLTFGVAVWYWIFS